MQQSTGQTAAQASSSWNPTHSVQSAGSMTKMSSPWLVAWLGHSGSHAPQLMHSSVMMVAISGKILPPSRACVDPALRASTRVELAPPWTPQKRHSVLTDPDRFHIAEFADSFAGQFAAV